MITSTKKLSLAAVSALALAAAIPAGEAVSADGMTEYGDGLQASSMATPVASSSADSLESLAGSAFAPLSAPTKYLPDDTGEWCLMVLDEDEAAHVESITSDGEGGYTVVYVVNGETFEIQFDSEDYTGGQYDKQIGDAQYYFWHAPLYSGVPPKPVARQYFAFVGLARGTDDGWTRLHSAYGVLTPAERLVNLGSATYEGHFGADVFKNRPGAGFYDILGFLWGEMTLEADFSMGSISGDVDTLWYRTPEGDWLKVPDTNSLLISDGEIDGNRFHADWHGQDTDADSDYSESVRDLDGSMLGAFYGPNGEEVGGVLTGQREETDEVINGRFGGESHAATETRELWGKFIPGRADGIAVSPGAAVYADSSEDTLSSLLPDGDTAFAPLSASVRRDWSNYETSHPDSGGAYVKSISSDGANGFHVAYVVDGRESLVHFSANDFRDDWGSFNVNKGPGGNDYWLWSMTDSIWSDPDNRTGGSSEFDYFDINGWVACVAGDCFEGHSTYGVRTRAADMPAGSATYEGRLAARIWDGDNPSYPSSVTDVRGDLALEVDFDGSAISGQIDGIAVRPENSGDWLSLGEGNSLDISNGRIVGSWFDADWAGVDSDSGSTPEDSMRGFAGTMEGEFFGPAAEEVGGVIGGHRAATATTPEQVIYGGLGGKQQD